MDKAVTTWELEDADVLALQNPYTFYKPSREVIAKVAPGEHVKLIFRLKNPGPGAHECERMWVVVDEVRSDGTFRGRLDNDPFGIEDLKADDMLEFGPQHIIATAHPEESLVEQYAVRCFATNRILRDARPVAMLYREKPCRPDDSGWRFLAGDETEEYMLDRENSAYVSLGAVLRLDDSILKLLEAPVGSAFQRDVATGQFDAAAGPRVH